MFQRRPYRSAPRTRSLAIGGALAALAVVGGGTVVAVSGPTEVAAGDILLAQNAATQNAAAQEMELGAPVNLDLEPVVARAAGGTIPPGTTVQVTGLPDGLTQDGWVISGTPTRAGDYDVLVTVSNGAMSQSQKLTVAVTDSPGTGAGTAATTTDAPSADGESGVEGDETTTTPSTTPQSDPTLSATPGDPDASGLDEGGTTADGAEDDDEVGISPDLCSVLGDGEMDGASLASLLPALLGDDDSASSGLVLVLVNAVVSLLPSVLGESSSMDSLGSAGQVLCTIAPSLLGGASAGQAADGTKGAAGTEGTAGTGGTAVTDGATGAAALGANPAALLGLLTTGAGSLGD